ncbi:MAG: hypothetical protein JXB10_17290 [Pirellulales bacterium]|nr:hypothetical protein [Pirellulales bacterium]
MTPHPLQQWFPQFTRALDRAPMAALMCAGAILLGIALAGARTSPPTKSTPPTTEPSEIPKPLIEGTQLLEKPGTFQLSGDRVTFLPARENRRFTVLENLVLENVAQSLASDPLPQTWIVSGKTTEYRGNNYLLLTYAVQKTQFLSKEDASSH